MNRLTDEKSILTTIGKAVKNAGLFKDIILKLAEYEDLEEQGLLIKLPCKVGDKVYTIFCDKVYEKTIDKIIINRFTTPQIWVETKLSFATSSLERWDIVIGKTVFLTQEEAEKALEDK